MTETPKKDEPCDVTKRRKVPYRTRWKVFQNAVHCINLKRAQDRWAPWQARSNAIIFDSFADCLEKVVHTKLKKFCIKKIHLSPSLPPKVILTRVLGMFNTKATLNVGIVQGKLVADEMTIEPKIDFRRQGISRAEVEQEKESEAIHCKTRA